MAARREVVSGQKCVCGKSGGKKMNSPPKRTFDWGTRHYHRLKCVCGRLRFRISDEKPNK